MRKALFVFLAFSFLMLTATVAPALAENLHVPEGAKLFYFTGGVSGEIDVPFGYPFSIHPWHVDKVRIEGSSITGGNSYGGAELIVYFHMNGSGSFQGWAPWGHFITSDNPADAVWLREFWYMSPTSDVDNTKSIPKNDLTVERHGNSIMISLKTQQQMVAHIPFTVWFNLPPFEMELKKFGGSVHLTEVWNNTGYGPLPGSNWVRDLQRIGFDGTGVFNCPTWGYNAKPIADCLIVMHGIREYIPP